MRLSKGVITFAVVMGTSGACARQVTSASVASPDSSLTALLAADREFAARAKGTDLVTGLVRMFDDSVLMGAPTGHVRGRAAAEQMLRTNPENPTSRIDWVPIRAGVSSDGEHGFTAGYVTTTRASGSIVPGKYLSYWLKGPSGWRVKVYKRVPRPAGEVSLAMLAPSIPSANIQRGDAATIARFAAELDSAERAFSADAGRIGVGPAFAKWAAPDAILAGGGPEWSPAATASTGSESTPTSDSATISWAPDDVIVASTGDLGASIGFVTYRSVNGERRQPFFTIWKRQTPAHAWRYVAE